MRAPANLCSATQVAKSKSLKVPKLNEKYDGYLCLIALNVVLRMTRKRNSASNVVQCFMWRRPKKDMKNVVLGLSSTKKMYALEFVKEEQS